jgi:hypothetical protein
LKFKETCEFTEARDEVWARASNLDAIPVYWHGTKEFEVTRGEGKIGAEVVFAFGGRGMAEVAVDEGSRTVTINYLEGPFGGRQTIAVGERAVEAEWDVSFKGVYKLLGPWIGSHFKSGTRNALKRLGTGSTEV